MRAHLPILATMLIALCTLTADLPAHAQEADADGYIPYVASENPLGWNIPYTFYNDPALPAYAIALKEMNPTFKKRLGVTPRPLIGIGEIDLNYDKLPELIAFPTEENEESGMFCNLNGLCPHYVIDLSGKKARVIGIVYGYKVNRGDTLKNGYFTLKAFVEPVKAPSEFIEYIFDPKTKEYRPEK